MMPDVADYSWLRLLLGFAVTMGLLAGLGFVLKHVSLRGISLSTATTKTRRLQIVESLGLDTKRRLVIARCDGREHLLLLSAEGDIVVETNLPAKET